MSSERRVSMRTPASANKTKANAKTIPYKRQLPVFIAGSAQNKENGDILYTPKTTTLGVEKGEEKEYHLLQALQTQKAFQKGDSSASVSIPIPSFQTLDVHASQQFSRHEREKFLINQNPSTSQKGDEGHGLRLDSYDADTEDIKWVESLQGTSNSLSIDEFETIIEVLENNSRTKIITLAAASMKLPDLRRNILVRVYDYWLDKRMNLFSLLGLPSATLIPIVPDEDDDCDTDNPYAAFRKRDPNYRRRSSRIINYSASGNSSSRFSQKTEEEKAIERAEKLHRMEYKIDLNSELDGNFCFLRNKRCRYRYAAPMGESSLDESDSVPFN